MHKESVSKEEPIHHSVRIRTLTNGLLAVEYYEDGRNERMEYELYPEPRLVLTKGWHIGGTDIEKLQTAKGIHDFWQMLLDDVDESAEERGRHA